MNPDLREFLFKLLNALIEGACNQGDEPIDEQAIREGFADSSRLEAVGARILSRQLREAGVRPWWKRRQIVDETLPGFLEQARQRAAAAFDLPDDIVGGPISE